MREEHPPGIDANIVRLARELNAFAGIWTVASCGGHPQPGPGQWPAGAWYVRFRADPTDQGWFALEFITWFINDNWRATGHSVLLLPTAEAPYLNSPGECLQFVIEGAGVEPDELASELERARLDLYVPPGVAWLGADVAVVEDEVEALAWPQD